MIIKIILLGILVSLISMIIKQVVPSISLVLTIIACVIITIFIIPEISQVINLINNISGYIDTNNLYIDTIMKIIGIAYITEIGASLCADCGEKAISTKIELSGKILIMATSVPIITQIFTAIITIIP